MGIMMTKEEIQKNSEHWYNKYKGTEKQLAKAKALLSKWVELYRPKVGSIPPTPIQVDTEQFLKEKWNDKPRT